MLTVTLPLLGQAGWHSRWVSPPRLPLNTDPFLEVCSLLPLQLVPRQVPFTRQPLHGQYDCSRCSCWVLWRCFICQCSPALGLMCYVMELCRHTWDCWALTCAAHLSLYVVRDLLKVTSFVARTGIWPVRGQNASGRLHGYFDQETFKHINGLLGLHWLALQKEPYGQWL